MVGEFFCWYDVELGCVVCGCGVGCGWFVFVVDDVVGVVWCVVFVVLDELEV